MRYHYSKPYFTTSMYGRRYICDHPVYNVCTLFEIGAKGLAVIQQRFDPKSKSTRWGDLESGFAMGNCVVMEDTNGNRKLHKNV